MCVCACAAEAAVTCPSCGALLPTAIGQNLRQTVHGHALTEQLDDCRDDLTQFGVTFDAWFSERSLFDS